VIWCFPVTSDHVLDVCNAFASTLSRGRRLLSAAPIRRRVRLVEGGVGLSDTLGRNRPAIVDITQILEDSLTAVGNDQWLRAAYA